MLIHCYSSKFYVKEQMHHHDDLGSKCAYTCHLSNKTTRRLGMEADIIRAGHILSTTSDWSRDISGSHLVFTHFHKPYLWSAEEDRLAGGLI